MSHPAITPKSVILGWLAGKEIAHVIQDYDHWVAFALLAFVGGKMLFDGWRGESVETRSDPTRGLMLVTLSLATSIDALAVGLSMAFLDVSVWLPAIVMPRIYTGVSRMRRHALASRSDQLIPGALGILMTTPPSVEWVILPSSALRPPS